GEIMGELDQHRIVQAERFSDLGALGRRGVDGNDLVDRIACETEHRERDDPDGDHDADGLDCPAKGESEHLFLSLPLRGGNDRGGNDKCRPFEVPAPQAANSDQELQMEKRHWNHNFASGVDLTFATYLAARPEKRMSNPKLH